MASADAVLRQWLCSPALESLPVFEWDEAAYFAPPELHVALGAQDAQRRGILSATWAALNTFIGDGAKLKYKHAGGAIDVKGSED
jgi:hypothetical protein